MIRPATLGRRVAGLLALSIGLTLLLGCATQPSMLPARTVPAMTGSQRTTEPSPATMPKTLSGRAKAAGHMVDCDKRKCIALTFDDGPGPYTTRLLGYLRAAEVPATFFMVGNQAAACPSVAKAVATDGNEIGVHTWDHADLTRLSPSRVAQEISSTVRVLRRDAGVRPTLLRPPYGAMDAEVHTAARGADLAIALWSVDTLDWKTRSTSATVAAALQGARRGRIILLHDIHPWSVAAVPAILRGLRTRGYTLVTVSNLLGHQVSGRAYRYGPTRRVS